MNLSRILEKGYFPKELPPPFTTQSYGEKSRYILTRWGKFENDLKALLPTETSTRQAKSRYKPVLSKFSISKLIEFNIAKGQYSRRKIEIPHPQAYMFLCKEIIKNWPLINKIYSLSNFSESKLYSEKDLKRSVRTKSKSWSKFKNKLTEISYNYKVQLKIDITNFYPTVYTHSIPWSLLSKENSKKYFKLKTEESNIFTNLLTTDLEAQKYQIGDTIDTLVRNCNDKQSVGLPIGPDSSFILSEMLASRLDHEINNILKDIDYECIRYYDDYYFYINSIGDGETILKKVQKVFYEYKLEMNENKVQIKQLPYFQSDLWNIEIHNYQFKNSIIQDIQELEYYFSLILKLVEQNKSNSAWIISYSLTRFEYGKVKIKKEHINIFVSLLLKTLYLDTSNIDQIFKIIFNYQIYLGRDELNKIKNLLDKLIKEHLLLNHSFEVAWGLWFYKTFDIECGKDLLQSIFDSEDQISILIGLDIVHKNSINKRKFNFMILNSKIKTENLYNKFWMINYECEIKNWLTFSADNIKDHHFFKILKDLNISFYEKDFQVKKNFTISQPSTTTSAFPDDFEDLFNLFQTNSDDDDEEENEHY